MFYMHGNKSYLGFLHLITVDCCDVILLFFFIPFAKFTLMCYAKGLPER